MPTPDADELLPWWMTRQCDPTSPDVVIGEGAAVNTTHRSWTLLGTVGDSHHAAIDPRGMVTPRVDSWSIDWWIGADDRWHLPSRSVAVRQHLVDDSPVVETTVRVPGGEVVHRAWAVAAGEGVPAGGAVIIELRNASAVPVAVAFAIRPFGPLGRAAVSQIELVDTQVLVDGRPALVLPKAPSRVAVGSSALGDALTVVRSGEADAIWPEGGVRCTDGRASAAFLFPLPHTATVRVLVPMAVPSAPRWPRRSVEPSGPVGSPASAPDSDRVVSGWEVQTRRSPRIELLELRADEALRSARRSALLHAAGDDSVSWSDGLLGVFDACSLIMALDEHGLHAEAAKLLMGLDDRIDVDGTFEQERHRIDAGAAWLVAVERHIRLADDAALARTLVGDVAKIAHRVHRDISAASGSRRSRASAGPSWIESAEALRAHDLIWAVRGLAAAAFALRVADQSAAAEEVERFRSAMVAARDEAIERSAHARTSATAVVTALAESGSTGAGAGTGGLAGILDVSAADCHGGAVWHAVGAAGSSPRLSAARAISQARAGDVAAVESLRWMLDVGAPTWSWPEFVHPRTGGGCGGDGHSPASTAAFLRFVRSVTALDTDEGIDALPVFPEQWLGQPIEVHDLPTAWGRFSFAIRWHGARPAVLWDLEPQTDASVRAALHPGSEPIVIRFSGLDRSWSTTELRGETLLSEPVTAPAAVLEDPDARTVAPDLAGEAPPAAVSGGTAPILPAAPAEGESFA